MSSPAGFSMPQSKAFEGSPWNRQAWETDHAFGAFRIFRGMGFRRTFAATARKLKVGEAQIYRWGTENRWRERASAWDSEMDLISQARHRREMDKMADDHAKVARALFARVVTRLKNLDVETMAPRDLIRWFEVSVRVERMARGAGDLPRGHVMPLPRPPAA